MSRKYLLTNKRIFVTFLFVLHGVSVSIGIKLQGVADMLHNFEGMDPEVLNLFTFNNKPAYRNKGGDASEIDIMDIDTSDILNCLSSLSYTCFQKKIIFYLDSLNRVDRINLFGGYMSFVKVSQGLTAPITEQMLVSRHITDETSLGSLLKEIFDDFIDSHILRITVPVINARLDARNSRRHCYDFTLSDMNMVSKQPSKDTTNQARGDPTCYRGDQSMVALSSALVMKMFMIVPTLLKVIAAKAIFGLLMGMVSVILSKMAILPLLMSYTKKNNNANGIPTGSSYRQGVNLTNFALTTDNYALYYAQEEQPGRIPTSGGSAGNDIAPVDYGPSGLNNDNAWAESKLSNKNYNNQNKDIKYLPRKERYRSMHYGPTPNPKKSGYPETVINGRSVDSVNMLTTAETNTEGSEKIRGTVNGGASIRAKRWIHNPYYKPEHSF